MDPPRYFSIKKMIMHVLISLHRISVDIIIDFHLESTQIKYLSHGDQRKPDDNDGGDDVGYEQHNRPPVVYYQRNITRLVHTGHDGLQMEGVKTPGV